MGNDGGSIPVRRELVKEAARNPTTSQLRATTLEQLAYAWRTCALSGESLKPPVVSDALGRLFNKDELIKTLLPIDKPSEAPINMEDREEFLAKADVKGLKDVVEVQFEDESEHDKLEEHKWVCPVTRKELGENTKAVYLVPCGHAFAETAIKQVDEEKCVQCNAPFASNDVITIFPTDEIDIAHLTLRMKTLQERGLTHALKKAKKSKAIKQAGTSKVDSEAKRALNEASHTRGIQDAATAALTARVLEEQELRNKKRKAAKNENLQSLYSTGAASKLQKSKNSDFMTRGFSIPAHQK